MSMYSPRPSFTYHPYIGQISRGDNTDMNLKSSAPQSIVAGVIAQREMTPTSIRVSEEETATQYIANASHKTPIYDAALIAAVQELRDLGFGPNAIMAQVKPMMADANRQNLTHLQMIRLMPYLLAFPESYFHLHNMFTSMDIPMLETRVALQDVYEQQGAVGRYQRTPDSDLQYAEVKFDLPKYPIRIPTPIEDIYRTIINPHESKVRQIQWARAKRHNTEALTQLKTISLTKNISKIDKLQGASEEGFHSANSTAGELTDIISDHLTTHHSQLTDIAMPTGLFRRYVENTWTFNVGGPRPNRIIQGVYDMPGVEGIRVIVDPNLDADSPNTMYVVDKMNGALYGQGPMLSKMYDDNERDAIVTKNTEFFEYLMVTPKNVIVNNDVSYDRQFALKINVATT